MPLTSAKMTFFYKRVFPIIWFGFLAVFVVVGLSNATDFVSALPTLVVPAAMAVIGYRFMKKSLFNLVDEVFDAGDALLVRDSGREERIPLADIKNVSYFPYMSPPLVTISLRHSTALGDRVVFCMPYRLIPQSSSPVIDKLVDRIDAARQRR